MNVSRYRSGNDEVSIYQRHIFAEPESWWEVLYLMVFKVSYHKADEDKVEGDIPYGLWYKKRIEGGVGRLLDSQTVNECDSVEIVDGTLKFEAELVSIGGVLVDEEEPEMSRAEEIWNLLQDSGHINTRYYFDTSMNEPLLFKESFLKSRLEHAMKDIDAPLHEIEYLNQTKQKS